MEVVADVLIKGSPLVGFATGWLAAIGANKIKIINNAIEKNIKKNGSKEAFEAFNNMKNLDKRAGKIEKMSTFFEFSSEYFDDGTKIAKNSKKLNLHETITKSAKKIFDIALATNSTRKGMFGLITAFIIGIPATLIALKMQKASSRAGRFVAKRELEQDPQNFVGYTKKEYDKVQEIKAEKKPNKFKEMALFLPRVVKQYFQYKKYKKNVINKDRKLKSALIKVDVTDKQLKNAKNLQRKLFNTFEEVDNKSQTYSESMEMAAETSKPFIMAGLTGLMLSPLIVFAIKIKKGKITPAQIISKIINKLTKFPKILESKFFKNYLNNIGETIKYKVKDAKIDKFVNIEKVTFQIESLKMFNKNKKATKTFIDDFIKMIEKTDESSYKKAMEALGNQNNLIKTLNLSSLSSKEAVKTLKNIQNMVDRIPEKDFSKLINTIIGEFKKNPEKFASFMKQGGIGSILMTKELKTLLTATGLTWMGALLLSKLAIASYIASLNLKAGRLGVMKGMEELKDPAYYANVEKVEVAKNATTTENTAPIKINNPQKNRHNLLEKYS